MENKASNDSVWLSHNQKHFDILEIQSRNFAKSIKDFHFTKNYSEEFSILYQNSYNDMMRMQQEYDRDTREGSNRVAQKEWNKKVETNLKQLSSIDGNTIKLNMP